MPPLREARKEAEEVSLETLLEAWGKTTPSERDRGRAFYWEAWDLCQVWAREFGVQQEQVAGIMAALSPNNSWQNNRASCRAVLEGRDWDVRSYRRDLIKALWILRGAHPARVLQGPKTYNFYYLMVAPWCERSVCIDGHMVNLVKGEKRPLKGIHLTRPMYEVVAEDVRQASGYVGELPSAVQAALWLAWRSSEGFKQGRLDV